MCIAGSAEASELCSPWVKRGKPSKSPASAVFLGGDGMEGRSEGWGNSAECECVCGGVILGSTLKLFGIFRIGHNQVLRLSRTKNELRLCLQGRMFMHFKETQIVHIGAKNRMGQIPG